MTVLCWLISSLVSWEFVEYFGTVIVICACWGEYAADFGKTISKCELARDSLAKRSTVILIAGLVVELVGIVGVALEGANTLESLKTSRAKLEGRVEELRAQNDELAAKWEWRKISPEQTNEFMFLAGRMHKHPVRVAIGTYSPELMSYAVKIRSLLNDAGFTTPESDTKATKGVRYDGPDLIIASPHDEFGNDFVKIVAEGVRAEEIYYDREFTNKFWRPVVTNGGPQFAAALAAIFTQSKIPAAALVWNERNRVYVTDAPYTVIVLPKPN
jgi:hypothetical protein